MQTIAEEVVRRLGPLSAGNPNQPRKQHQIGECPVVKTPLCDERPQLNLTSSTNGASSAVPADQVGTPVHIGAESLASILIDVFKSGKPREDYPQTSEELDTPQPLACETMKLLYMTDTGSTHPFANLWQPGAKVEDICLALPDNETFEQ